MGDIVLSEARTALLPAMGLEEAKTRYNDLVRFCKTILQDGVDYGAVPGTDKKTLLKPGAEKIVSFFGLSACPEIIERVEDWTGTEHGEPLFYYMVRYHLYRGEHLIASADGSCNSWEAKYRWRWVAEHDIPQELDKSTLKKRGGKVVEFGFAVDKAETGGKYGKPTEYWQQFKDAIANDTAVQTTKKIKDGREFMAWEIDSTLYRIPNDDIFTLVNTVLKQASKRAFVAVTLIGTGASQFFTQDLEDYDYGITVIEGEFSEIETEKRVETPPQKKQPARHNDTVPTGEFNLSDMSDTIKLPDFCTLVAQHILVERDGKRVPYYRHQNHIINAYREIIGDNKAAICKSDGTVISPRQTWKALQEHAEAQTVTIDVDTTEEIPY